MHGRMVYALNIFSTVAPAHERLPLTRSGEDMRLLRNCKEKNIDTVNSGAYCRYHPFPCGGASAIFLLTKPPQSRMRRLCGLRKGCGCPETSTTSGRITNPQTGKCKVPIKSKSFATDWSAPVSFKQSHPTTKEFIENKATLN